MAILLRAGQVVDGTGAPPLAPGAVRILDGQIAGIGRAEQLPPALGDTVLDLGPGTLLPGLIDAHNHLRIDTRRDARLGHQMGQPDAEYILQGLRLLRTDFESGVTSMKLNGDARFLDLAVREAQRRGDAIAPHLWVSTRGLKSPTAGGGVAATLLSDDPAEIRRLVRENAERGADFIKIFVTGSIVKDDVCTQYLGRSQIAAAVEAAHSAGLKVSAHCHGGPGADDCIAAGVDIIEHGSLMTPQQFDRMRERGLWLCMTVGVMAHPIGLGAQAERDGVGGPWLRDRIAAVKAAMASAMRSGVRFTVGTDGMHGLLGYELELLVELGQSPLRAIRAATLDAAEFMGRDCRLGSLAPGKDADLIYVAGDPVREIRDIYRVTQVIQGGRVYTVPFERPLAQEVPA